MATRWYKIINSTTGECIVSSWDLDGHTPPGQHDSWFQSRGYTKGSVEQGPGGRWYISGKAPDQEDTPVDHFHNIDIHVTKEEKDRWNNGTGSSTGASVIIDQHYNENSANAQSGKAVAEAVLACKQESIGCAYYRVEIHSAYVGSVYKSVQALSVYAASNSLYAASVYSGLLNAVSRIEAIERGGTSGGEPIEIDQSWEQSSVTHPAAASSHAQSGKAVSEAFVKYTNSVYAMGEEIYSSIYNGINSQITGTKDALYNTLYGIIKRSVYPYIDDVSAYAASVSLYASTHASKVAGTLEQGHVKLATSLDDIGSNSVPTASQVKAAISAGGVSVDSSVVSGSVNPVSGGAVYTAIYTHSGDTSVHVTEQEKSTWNAKAESGDITEHANTTATTTRAGHVKLGSDDTAASAYAGKVCKDEQGRLSVKVATASTPGVVKIASDTKITDGANVQINSSNQLKVPVATAEAYGSIKLASSLADTGNVVPTAALVKSALESSGSGGSETEKTYSLLEDTSSATGGYFNALHIPRDLVPYTTIFKVSIPLMETVAGASWYLAVREIYSGYYGSDPGVTLADSDNAITPVAGTTAEWTFSSGFVLSPSATAIRLYLVDTPANNSHVEFVTPSQDYARCLMLTEGTCKVSYRDSWHDNRTPNVRFTGPIHEEEVAPHFTVVEKEIFDSYTGGGEFNLFVPSSIADHYRRFPEDSRFVGSRGAYALKSWFFGMLGLGSQALGRPIANSNHSYIYAEPVDVDLSKVWSIHLPSVTVLSGGYSFYVGGLIVATSMTLCRANHYDPTKSTAYKFMLLGFKPSSALDPEWTVIARYDLSKLSSNTTTLNNSYVGNTNVLGLMDKYTTSGDLYVVFIGSSTLEYSIGDTVDNSLVNAESLCWFDLSSSYAMHSPVKDLTLSDEYHMKVNVAGPDNVTNGLREISVCIPIELGTQGSTSVIYRGSDMTAAADSRKLITAGKLSEILEGLQEKITALETALATKFGLPNWNGLLGPLSRGFKDTNTAPSNGFFIGTVPVQAGNVSVLINGTRRCYIGASSTTVSPGTIIPFCFPVKAGDTFALRNGALTPQIGGDYFSVYFLPVS